MIMKKLLPFIALCLLTFSLVASDYAKEQRWADQTVDSILDGEAVWLKAGEHEFLSIFTPDEDEQLSDGVIVIHGTGIHPNWDQVVRPLRVELTTLGWSTLSIQMPILANDADHDDYAPLYPEVAPRIDAAIDYLKALGIERIYLVSHSQGATMTSYYLAQKQPAIIKGFVAIGMSGAAKHPAMDSLIALKKFALPTLDLFGSEDLPQVLSAREDKRKAALSLAGRDFEQIEIESANHFFDGRNDILIETVNDWLAKRR